MRHAWLALACACYQAGQASQTQPPDAPAIGDATDDGTQMTCGWRSIQTVDPCMLDANGETSDWSIGTGTTTLVTNTQAITGDIPGSDALTIVKVAGGRQVLVVRTRSFAIADDGVLEVSGQIPLVVLANSTVDVEGRIDFVETNGAPASALDGGASPTGTHGGGGGGGNGTAGAFGGASATNTSSIGQPGQGAAGALVIGGRGGASGNGTDCGGGGGGGVQISGKGLVTITSTIRAGGEGGAAGCGGGAGGTIILEGTALGLGSATLCANGGGGGGAGMTGSDGSCSENAAVGGSGEGMGGDGGSGGATSLPTAGTPGTIGELGGGGGGAAGFILIDGVSANPPLLQSPPAKPGP